MLRQLQTKLEKLERTSRRAQQAYDEAHHRNLLFFVMDALGYYYGDPKPGQDEHAWARALGYADWYELERAMLLRECQRKNPELDERWNGAIRKLFVKFGSSPDVQGTELVEVLKRMHTGMSEEYKKITEAHLRGILAKLKAA